MIANFKSLEPEPQVLESEGLKLFRWRQRLETPVVIAWTTNGLGKARLYVATGYPDWDGCILFTTRWHRVMA